MIPSEVLVVGAGPTGLMLACTLARQGLRPRVLERRAAPSVHSKALAIQPRSIEILESLGVVDAFLARGRRLTHVAVRTAHGQLTRIGLDALDSPFPFILVLPQSETERLLEAHLRTLGVEVERRCTLEHFEADAGGVHCTLSRPDGTHDVLDARWMVGCDGARSTVRQRIGVAWRGDDLPGVFVLADVRVEAPGDLLPGDQATVWFSPDGVLGFIPLPTASWFRIVAALPANADVGATPTLALFERLVARRATGLDARLTEASWLSRFEVHQRKVDTWRAGRVLLAGDAAHCHSPVGGQGMNTGLQDAWNLGWKLALVSRGHGCNVLLDSYQAERDAVARALLQGTARGTRMVTLRNPVTRLLRDQLARLVGGLEGVRQYIAAVIGETAIAYPDSPIVGEHRGPLLDPRRRLGERRDFGAGPQPGDRAPDVTSGSPGQRRRLFELLDAAHHTLLLFGGRAPSASRYAGLSNVAHEVAARYGRHLRPHIVVLAAASPDALVWRDVIALDPDGELHDRYGASAECLYLIRPDGHIAFRSQPVDADALFDHLAQIFA